MVFSHEVKVTELKLYQFKNHENTSLSFCDKINAISGLNGSGKTNILDAIYYICSTKSYFNPLDNQLIQFEKTDASIYAKVRIEQEYEILGSFGENRKKTFKRNGKPYTRLIDHIGFIKAVFITPYDISLVFEGSEERRKFIDYTISQVNKSYLNDLLNYRKTIDQRNAFLKNLDGKMVDPLVLESFNHRLSPIGDRICSERKKFIDSFLPFFSEIHSKLSQGKPQVNLKYESQLIDRSFSELLIENHNRDIFSMRTSVGIHKDDLIFEIDEMPLKRFGSQGQIKSFVVALKLAQYQYLKEISNDNPVLLLDDIFEKIDAERSQKLMELVCSDQYGQIFISDTHAERIKEHFATHDVEFKLFEIS